MRNRDEFILKIMQQQGGGGKKKNCAEKGRIWTFFFFFFFLVIHDNFVLLGKKKIINGRLVQTCKNPITKPNPPVGYARVAIEIRLQFVMTPVTCW